MVCWVVMGKRRVESVPGIYYVEVKLLGFTELCKGREDEPVSRV